MRNRRDGFPANLLVTALVLVWMAAVGLTAAGGRKAVDQTSGTPAASPASAAPAAASVSQATGFVGDETCATCHEAEGKSLRTTLHGKSQNSRTPAAKAGQSCETCHGPVRSTSTRARRKTSAAST